MLRRCRDQFLKYGDLHADKSPPQVDKALANYELAAQIIETLSGNLTVPAQEPARK